MKPSIYAHSPFPHASVSKCNMGEERKRKKEPISNKGHVCSVLACALLQCLVHWSRWGRVHKDAGAAFGSGQMENMHLSHLHEFFLRCFLSYPQKETFKSWRVCACCQPSVRGAAACGASAPVCPAEGGTQQTSRRPRLTCADRDGANKLLPPAAAPHHQGQVCLLDQLVHRALWTRKHNTEGVQWSPSANKQTEEKVLLRGWERCTGQGEYVKCHLWELRRRSAEIGHN